MIRLEGAEVLCDSIRTNRTLTHLDLSYNALGRSAAEVLGAALMQNDVRLIGPIYFLLLTLLSLPPDHPGDQHRQQWY
jgi:hypothetical protein